MRRWPQQIAAVPKGYETLVSSGKVSAPMSSNLINRIGESIDIFFNFDIPDSGSHWVYDRKRSKIDYRAIQNLYHELARAMHMVNGTWAYAKSERQSIEEENPFRRQLAEIDQQPCLGWVCVSGAPICPATPDLIDDSRQQGTICI